MIDQNPNHDPAARARRLSAAWLVAAVALGSALAVPRPALAPGDPAPDLAAPALGSESPTRVRWSNAPLTVVNFWATWCGPCRSEMPALEALRKSGADRGLAVYGVLLDSATDEAGRKFADDLGIGYPVLRGSVTLSDHWGGIGLMPTTFLVDGKGIVRRRYVGATSDTIERMKADVAQLLESAPSTAPPKK